MTGLAGTVIAIIRKPRDGWDVVPNLVVDEAEMDPETVFGIIYPPQVALVGFNSPRVPR